MSHTPRFQPGGDVVAMDAVLARFVEHAPVSVMARLTLQQAVSAEWVNEVFERHREAQYTRELLFSTVVELVSSVAMGQFRSLHAAAKKAQDLPVSIAALYKKIDRTEPSVVRALVQGSAKRLGAVARHLRKTTEPLLPGYRVRIVDGNHHASTEKRLAPLRDFRGAALPGQSMVVYDPELGMAVDLIPCEDAYTSEQVLFDLLIATAQPDELWIGDRHFCTRKAIFASWRRGTKVLFRESSATPNPTAVGAREYVGTTETGTVYEQRVWIPDEDGTRLELRRIEIDLNEPNEDGDTVIRLLTTLPAEIDAVTVANLYRRRWTIEAMFGRLESALHGEVRALGYPRAALLAFGLAVIAHSMLSVLETAISVAHDLGNQKVQVSKYHLAESIRTEYRGMMIAILASTWAEYDAMSPAKLASTLLKIAATVSVRAVSKSTRGPKPKKTPGYAPRKAVASHVSTARVLRDGAIKPRR